MKNNLILLIYLAGLNCLPSVGCAQLAPAANQPPEDVETILQKADELQYTNFTSSDSLYEIASRKLIEVGIEKDPVRWISVLHRRANSALFHSKLPSAKRHSVDSYSAIDKFRNVLHAKSDSLRAETQQIEAGYFFVVGNYFKALENLNEAEIYLRNRAKLPARCETLYRILQFQASIYQQQGEIESCIDRYMASIQYYDCYRDPTTFPNYILVNRNIALAYLRMNNIAKARHHFSVAKKNLDSCPKEFVDAIFENHAVVLYNSMGEFYRTQNKIDSAKFFLEKASSMTAKNQNYNSRVNEGLAKVALAEKDYATAHKFFEKSLAQTLQSRGEKHYLTANLYRAISALYLEEHDVQNSLLFIQKALKSGSSSDAGDLDDYTKNPPLSSLSMQKQTLITLHQKATTLTAFYQQTQSQDFLISARNTNLLAIQFLDSTRNEFSLDKDKVVLGDDAIKVYQNGLYLSSVLYRKTRDPKYLSECFELMDKSRGAVLMDHVKLVKSFSGIPVELQNRERELKVELSIAEQQLYTAEIKKEETGSSRQHFGEIKKEYTKLLNDIKIAAPNYYKLKIENRNLSLTETQNMLAHDEALVEYFLGDSLIYTLVVTPRESNLYTSSIDSTRLQVESLRNLIANPKFGDANFQRRWKQHMTGLSQKLLTPWYTNLTSTNHIIVVPHDVLNYLPFEMLPMNTSDDVLLNHTAVSYASSANLLREQRNMNATGNFFAGFHADYSKHETLPQLIGATGEVNAIKDILGFRSSLFTAATADDFRKEASQYKIIHLALHSLVNDEKPMFSRLVFTQTDSLNADITANELYSMELNAEIAVLSACETGLGKLHRGEGMMSLSRAFMYAGVPSTVISLWKVPDQSASILMTKFYQFLKNGERKDDALRLAKLEFIEDHPEMSHPFFWAGFIVNGKTDPVSFSNFKESELMSAAIITLTVLVTIAIVLRRKRNKKLTALIV